MKKIIPLLALILLIFSGCTNPQPEQAQTTAPVTEIVSEDTTPSISATDVSSVSAETSVRTTSSDNQQTTLPKTTSPQTAPPQTEPVAPTTQADSSVITVSVYCSCKNAVNYGIRDKKDYASFIPEDGVLFNSTITVQEGSTAMDAIKSACLQSNVKIDEKRGYISGIGGLSEKACGGSSGWMYSVNSVFPNVSSDKYTLSSGDRIELHYTVKNGDVL